YAALHFHQLCDQLADEPEANHSDSIAKLYSGRPHGVQGDAAKSCEASLFERDGLWNSGHQISSSENRFGMARALAAVRDTIADPEVCYGGMFLDDYARSRITENPVFAEFRTDLPQCRHRTGNLHDVPYFLE